jgi:hypothetical protein
VRCLRGSGWAALLGVDISDFGVSLHAQVDLPNCHAVQGTQVQTTTQMVTLAKTDKSARSTIANVTAAANAAMRAPRGIACSVQGLASPMGD